MAPSLKVAERNLIRRYLIWCYKTTKEDLDRIDRKFTQVKVDDYILRNISKANNTNKNSREGYGQLVEEFKQYMLKKEKDAIQSKFLDEQKTELQPRYVYLKNRLSAVEKAISVFLGRKELNQIILLYEGEMTRRIIEAREHT